MDLTGFGSIFDFGSKVIDKLFPDPEKANAAKIEMIKLQQAGEFKQIESALEMAKGQMEINKIEASHASIFVAGARPFIMWTCGISFAYAAVIEPIARFISLVMFGYIGIFPVLDTTITMQVLFGILGLGAMRSYDKGNILKKKE